MSVITYNGITLPYANGTRFNQEVIRDDSNTDRIYIKYDISTTCVFNANYLSILAPLVNANSLTSPAQIMVAIRNNLLKDRQQLSVMVGNQELIPQSFNSGTVDARNGPQPQYCNITELTTTTFMVEYGIIAHYWEPLIINDPLSGNGQSFLSTQDPADQSAGLPAEEQDQNPAGTPTPNNVVISHRWTESVDMDETMLTTRARIGKIIIRSDNTLGWVADQVRSTMAVCSVPEGFVRKAANYTVDPSGLIMTYRLVDREVFKMPPQPAFSAEGYFVEDAPYGTGMRTGTVWVRLKGSKYVQQDQLIVAAMNVARAKLIYNGAVGKVFGNSTQSMAFKSNLKVDMYNNVVEFLMMVILRKPGARKGQIAGYSGSGQTFTPGSDDLPTPISPPYEDRGTASLIIQAAAYYDPTLTGTTLQVGANSTPLVANQFTRGGGGDTTDGQDNLSVGLQPGQAGVTKENI